MSKQSSEHQRLNENTKFTNSCIIKNPIYRKPVRQQEVNYTNKITRHGSQDDFKRYKQHNQTTVTNTDLQNTARKGQEYNFHGKEIKTLHIPSNRPQERSVETEKKKAPNRQSGGKGQKNKEPIQSGLKSYKSQKVYPSFIRICQPKISTTLNIQKAKKKISRQRFRNLRKLGQGKSGKVYLAQQYYSKAIVALKIMQKSKIIKQNLLQQFIRELKIQTFLNHPNVIKNYGFFCDENYFYTVMQVGCDGQLYDHIEKNLVFSEESTSFIVNSLLNGVHCLHEQKILHRDIKPQNIVLVHGNVKLCDFGWAVNKKDQLRSTFCGTPLYLSPQLLSGSKYDEKVDLWAIGVLAYQLHIGCSPFNIKQKADLSKIISHDIQFPKNKKTTRQFRQFIRAILRKNPKQRMSCQQLQQLQFIKKYQELETCQQLCY